MVTSPPDQPRELDAAPTAVPTAQFSGTVSDAGDGAGVCWAAECSWHDDEYVYACSSDSATVAYTKAQADAACQACCIDSFGHRCDTDSSWIVSCPTNTTFGIVESNVVVPTKTVVSPIIEHRNTP